MVNLRYTHKFHPEDTKRWNHQARIERALVGVWGSENGLLAHRQRKQTYGCRREKQGGKKLRILD